MLSRQIQINGADLYVETHGSGPDLVCLHNFSSNGRTRFYPLLPILSPRFTCHLIDMRGHGRSTNPGDHWTHEQAARDTIALAEALGIRQARFLATSSGGMTMLRVARYKAELVQAMVLDSATYRVPREAVHHYRAPISLSPRLRAYYEAANEIYGAGYWEVLARTFYDFRLPECDINVPLETLAGITCPTYLIVGDRDIFFPPHIHLEMHRAIANSRLLIAPETGHIVMEQHPELVAGEALKFFASLQSQETRSRSGTPS